ncbi:DNA polymerase alpha subunit B [Diachasma alloeum]|uniref:DNA polymerase alpha subunit B n=1 Tax=Diachasma alloeum TaxID=454923 RepID=UPI0007383316|nr:DNA polymerase alpha subunit B [Diachasma alloeum]
MVKEEILTQYFDKLSYTVEDKQVLLKCLDLCDLYERDEATFVEEWVGYVASKNYEPEDSNPSLETLTEFENSVLKKRRTIKTDDEGPKSEMGMLAASGSSKIFVDDEGILEMYGYKPSTPSIKRLRSPEHAEVINPENKVRAVESSYSPASYTAKAELPKRDVDTNISGKVIQQFGNYVETWNNESSNKIVKLTKTTHPYVPSDQTYMFDILSRRLENLENYCSDMGKRISDQWPIDNKEMIVTANVMERIQEPFRTFGRVKCERMGAGSFILQNWFVPEDDEKVEDEDSSRKRKGCCVSTSLNLSKLKQFSIFPGEIVVVEGINPGTETFIVREMKTIVGVQPTPPPNITQTMQIVVACGPFTQRDRLDFQPLMNLMQNVAETEPNLLVLVGPFVPQDNEDIKQAVVVNTLQEVFEEFVEKIMNFVKGSCTQILLMSSSKDAHHDNVYPTPEYFIPQSLKSSNIHTISDPCMISVDGLSIGATSVDILKHLAGKEISHNMGGTDRVARLAEHVLQQACFYPLYPPSKEINMDIELWEKYAHMKYRPHILLLPSSLKPFCKWSDDTFIINPGDMSKNLYARLKIRPTDDNSWKSNCIDCEILKV